jgi:diguanylate cyclase (GGDEF)-like protein
MGDRVVSGGRMIEESGGDARSSADLAGALAALCCECVEFSGVLACSIVLKDEPSGFFSATGSAEWACALDDFQLSEETGPTWECCQTSTPAQGDGHGQRGLTGSDLAEHLSTQGAVGARALPLMRDGAISGALTLYWGPSARPEDLMTPGAALAATVTKAIERQYREETSGNAATRVAPAATGAQGEDDHDGGGTFQEREALSEARHARAVARDARAAERDARAAERDARAAQRDECARARDAAAHAHDAAQGWTDREMIAIRVMARRDRSAAARDRFHAKSDRAAARLDRVVSAIERVESSIDGLTGAYRREAGMMELEHEITRARRTGDTFVLAFVDVNNLKARNDTHGHLAGDRLLRKIADTLRANVRSYDLVVRYGGDEFVCGFPALDVHDAAERFARINGDLAATEEASVAFGLAELGTDDSLADLITRADSIMYANRYQRLRAGGNAANAHAATTHEAQAVGRVTSNAE